ncbi:hypothetical protein HPP92_024661 [Vanilla planifolia]|uniref:Leucine-rich repeat-containing N-terminal plant-type domain-containing protein n=1 Tax=Vanilla planifolia TaxID=51239 RepID=A0A835PPF2_VANPL|nr:hypothetical protein HPP92_024661 [Vanilla planifolia]
MMRKTSAVPLLLLLPSLLLPHAVVREVAPLLTTRFWDSSSSKPASTTLPPRSPSWSPDDQISCSWSHVSCLPSGEVPFALPSPPLPLRHSQFPPRAFDLLLPGPSLSDNHLSGPLPSPFPSLPRITSLSMSHAALSGPIPESLFSSCSTLRFLDLSSNSLSGPIPPSLSSCSFLVHLNLSSNLLSGDASPAFSSFTHLRTLDLSYNFLSGPLPASIALLHNLRLLNLTGNSFFGRLPLGLAFLPHLLLHLRTTSLRRLPHPFSLTSPHSKTRPFWKPPHWNPPVNFSASRISSFDLLQSSLATSLPISSCSKLSEPRWVALFTGSIPTLFNLRLQVLDPPAMS